MDEGCNRERFPRSGARRVSNSYLRARRPDYGAGRKTIWEFRLLHQLPDCAALGLTQLSHRNPIPLPVPTPSRSRKLHSEYDLCRKYKCPVQFVVIDLDIK